MYTEKNSSSFFSSKKIDWLYVYGTTNASTATLGPTLFVESICHQERLTATAMYTSSIVGRSFWIRSTCSFSLCTRHVLVGDVDSYFVRRF